MQLIDDDGTDSHVDDSRDWVEKINRGGV